MFRYKLRTLLIVLALGPATMAGCWWGWLEWQKRQAADALGGTLIIHTEGGPVPAMSDEGAAEMKALIDGLPTSPREK